MSDDRMIYTVTERAGPRVAGRRAAAGDEIALTAAEAESELRLGTIVPRGAQLAAGFAASEKAAALRAEATAFRTGARTAPAPGVTAAIEAPSKAPRAAVKAGSKG